MEPTVRTHPTRRLPTALVLTAALLATGCSEQSDDGREPAATESSGTPHGYVEGAREAAEEQSRLILGDPGTGASRVLDLVTGKVHESAPVTGADGLSTDGRFGFFHTDRGTHVVDGGAWTVDHGDHVHYYRAAIRHVGDLPGGRGAEIRSDAAVTAATDPEGRTTLYDRTALEKGEVGRPGRSTVCTPAPSSRTRSTWSRSPGTTSPPRSPCTTARAAGSPRPPRRASGPRATPSPAAASSSGAPTGPCS